jgi:hypothetical protein
MRESKSFEESITSIFSISDHYLTCYIPCYILFYFFYIILIQFSSNGRRDPYLPFSFILYFSSLIYINRLEN